MARPSSDSTRLASALGEDARATLRDAAKVVGWGLALYAVVVFVGIKLSVKATGALAAQMLIAEWGAGRLAIAWSDPSGKEPTFASIARRASKGALAGAIAAVLVVAFALATHAAVAHSNRPEPTELVVGLVTAGLLAARDELLLRGVVIRAFRHVCPTPVLLALCGAAAAAASYGVLGAESFEGGPVVLVVSALLGVAFGALWLRDRGAWLAFGAHTAWSLLTGPAIAGGLFDLRAASPLWGGGSSGLGGSLAAAAALVPLVALAVARSRAPQKAVGSAPDVRK